MTIKTLLPSPRYTCYDATQCVLRNIRNFLTNCIFKAVNVREGVSWRGFVGAQYRSFVCLGNVKCRNVASWEVYLGDGSNALIVMEDISKTLY